MKTRNWIAVLIEVLGRIAVALIEKP